MALFDVVVFVICGIVYLVNQHLLKPLIGGNFIMYHLNDFLAIIVFMSLANLTLVLFRPYTTRINSLHHILLLAITCSVYWEVIAPTYKESTPDWVDAICYIVGSVCYWFLNRICSRASF